MKKLESSIKWIGSKINIWSKKNWKKLKFLNNFSIKKIYYENSNIISTKYSHSESPGLKYLHEKKSQTARVPIWRRQQWRPVRSPLSLPCPEFEIPDPLSIRSQFVDDLESKRSCHVTPYPKGWIRYRCLPKKWSQKSKEIRKIIVEEFAILKIDVFKVTPLPILWIDFFHWKKLYIRRDEAFIRNLYKL